MSASTAPGQQQDIEEYASDDDDRDRCAAISASTSERCQRAALPGLEYCGIHFHQRAGD
jgi:hypothetical protein